MNDRAYYLCRQNYDTEELYQYLRKEYKLIDLVCLDPYYNSTRQDDETLKQCINKGKNFKYKGANYYTISSVNNNQAIGAFAGKKNIHKLTNLLSVFLTLKKLRMVDHDYKNVINAFKNISYLKDSQLRTLCESMIN